MSMEDLSSQVAENTSNDHTTTSCPSIASVSSNSAAFTAKDNAVNEPPKQNYVGSELYTDTNVEVISKESSAKKNTKVRKSSSPTPLRTRSGLTRLPIKRTRAVAKPSRKKSDMNEQHVSWIAPSSSMNVPNSDETVVSDTQLPMTAVRSQNAAELLSALSIKNPITNNCAPNRLGINSAHISFIPNASSSGMFDIQHQPSTGENNINNPHVQVDPQAGVTQPGCLYANLSKFNNFLPYNPHLFNATGGTQTRGAPLNANNLFFKYECSHTNRSVISNRLFN